MLAKISLAVKRLLNSKAHWYNDYRANKNREHILKLKNGKTKQQHDKR